MQIVVQGVCKFFELTDTRVISEVTGHYSMESTRRTYARFSPESTLNAVRQTLDIQGIEDTNRRIFAVAG